MMSDTGSDPTGGGAAALLPAGSDRLASAGGIEVTVSAAEDVGKTGPHGEGSVPR